jgi:hypothetical protein
MAITTLHEYSGELEEINKDRGINREFLRIRFPKGRYWKELMSTQI